MGAESINSRINSPSSEKRSVYEAQILLEIARASGSTLDLDIVLDRVVEKTASLTGADRCSIWLYDEERSLIIPAALYGMDAQFTRSWKDRPLPLTAELLSLEVIQSSKPAVVFDAQSDPRTDKKAVAMFDDRSMLVVPLISRGKVIGTLFTNHVGASHSYTEQDIAITLAIASQAAIAIDNAKLYEESLRISEELTASLGRIGEALATGLRVNDTLQMIVSLAADIVHADIGMLELVEETGRLVVEATIGIDCSLVREKVEKEGDPLASEVLRRKDPFLLTEVSDTAQVWSRPLFGEPIGAYLGVPLRSRGQIRGVLSVYARDPDSFGPSALHLLSTFANQAVVAIDNATLFSKLQKQVSDLSRAMDDNAVLFKSLQTEKEHLDAIIHNSSDSIYTVDSQLRIVSFNPAAEMLTGWRASEAIGKDCSEILHCTTDLGLNDCQVDCPMRQAIESKESIPYVETKVCTREGQMRDIAASYSYVPNRASNNPLGVAILRDISRIREVERLKSDFVSMVSHELRTPLTVIKGYAATLLNPNLKLDREREKRFIGGINDASDKLVRLIDNLLSVSHLESGRFKTTKRAFDLSELAGRVTNIHRQSSPNRQINLILPEESIRVRADQDQIDQVLSNLLGNAIKYSPDGGEIVITVEHCSGEVEVVVKDKGVGIPRSQLGRVFEKFFRGDSNVTRRVSGTGLGLYICKSIIEAHGGRIWVESQPDSGSTFHFLLPLT